MRETPASLAVMNRYSAPIKQKPHGTHAGFEMMLGRRAEGAGERNRRKYHNALFNNQAHPQ
jgi:hypothetical protein